MFWWNFFLSLAMLSIAAFDDLKSREIDDKLWYLFAFFGFLAAVIEIQFNAGQWMFFAVTVGLTFVLMELLIFLGEKQPILFIGPADLKAIMVLSVFYWNSMLFALLVFVLALGISLIHALKAVMINLVKKPKMPSGLLGIALFLTAYPVKISGIKHYFVSPMQEINVSRKKGKWIEKRSYRFIPLIEPKTEIDRLKRLVKQGKIKDWVLVSELPAFMLFILISFILLFILLQLPFAA